MLTVAEVYALAEAVGPRYRALVLLACFCGLRRGELAALRRCDIDTDASTVRVTSRTRTRLRAEPLMPSVNVRGGPGRNGTIVTQ